MWFGLISSLSLIFPLIAGLFFYYRNGKLQTIFLGFVVFSVLFEAVSTALALNGIDNRFMFKLFLTCDFLFFAWFFKQHRIYPKWMQILTATILGFILFEFVDSLFFHTLLYSSNLFFKALFLYFIILSFYVLTTLLDDFSPTSNPILWIASARLFYYMCVFVIYVSSSIPFFNFNNAPFSEAFTIINGVGNIVCNILFGVSFLCKRVQV